VVLAAFCAVLYKNSILQLRGRFGNAWAGLLLQVLLPAACLCLMCVYKHYLPPVYHPQLQQDAYDIDTKWWAGAVPYTGEQNDAVDFNVLSNPPAGNASAAHVDCCGCMHMCVLVWQAWQVDFAHAHTALRQ
jgi:hypothetical protein